MWIFRYLCIIPVAGLLIGYWDSCFESSQFQSDVASNSAEATLYKKTLIPTEFLLSNDSLTFGGDIRIGDLTGNGQVDFLVYRSEDDAHDGGGMKPCFWGAFSQDGEIIWQRGKGGEQPSRPGPVAIFDIDQDGASEVITFAHQPDVEAPYGSLKDVEILIMDGAKGTIEIQAKPAIFSQIQGEGANWVHQRILIANLRGLAAPQDFIIKTGTHVLAFDNELNLLWSYKNEWKEYSRVPAYVPAIGDVDSDGKDEVNGGYFLIDDDGQILWEEMLGQHMDAVVVDYWDHPTKKRAFASGFGHILDEQGNVILRLGKDIVPHGQELRVAYFDNQVPGPQMMIRYNGHHPDVMLVSRRGEVLRRFQLNESPNNTGMEAVYWQGFNQPAMLYNGGQLWSGQGELAITFKELPPPRGSKRQGWYHCIPANVCGDTREEVILYNPWDTAVYTYTSSPLNENAFAGYQPQPRQYNVRLMD
ncbi:MAG: hypothetical protein AAF992_06975 [Bacteroidota bacterium]